MEHGRTTQTALLKPLAPDPEPTRAEYVTLRASVAKALVCSGAPLRHGWKAGAGQAHGYGQLGLGMRYLNMPRNIREEETS